MKVDLTEQEAKEVVLALRHLFDASVEYFPRSESASHVYISVISKLQEGLGMDVVSPWDRPEAFDVT
jgi:hypothetical protein